MQKAERALDEARVLLREAKTEGACSRAYYAMHDAAHAALLATGHEAPDAPIKTHHSLIAEFGKKLVLGGQMDAAAPSTKCRTRGNSPITAPIHRLLPTRIGRLSRPRILLPPSAS